MNYKKLPFLFTAIVFSLVFFTWINFRDSIADYSDSAILVSNQENSQENSRQETSEKKLPLKVQSAVLEAASQQTSRTVASLKILESQPKEWSDGCLGLTEPGKVCIQQVISGWQVKVTDGIRNWTFRTDEIGGIVKLEKPNKN